MEDFNSNINKLDEGESQLLGQIIQNFSSEGSFESKVGTMLRWISEEYYSQNSYFLPEMSLKNNQNIGAQQFTYGGKFSQELSDDNIDATLSSLVSKNGSYSYGLIADLEEEDRIKLATFGITSFFVIPLIVRSKYLGCIAFTETEVDRIWVKEQLDSVKIIVTLFATFLLTESLERELFSKEDILQKAIESSNDGYWHIDLVQNKMHFSRQWKRMLGYDEGEVSDSFTVFEEMIHPDDRDLVLQVLDPYMKEGVGSYECKYRLRNKSGKYLWVLTRASINYSENGIPEQFVATNTDITSRIVYKRKLEQSEEKFKRLIGSIHEIIFEVDKNGVITFLNEAWERQLLLRVEKTVGSNADRYVHPDDRGVIRNLLRKKYAGNEFEHESLELRMIAANGASIWVNGHFTTRYDEQHDLAEIKGTLINIDDQKKAEIDKRFNENRVAQISRNITDLIVELDENGKYLFVSNAVHNMLGKSPANLIGKSSMLDVYPEDRRVTLEQLFKPLLAGSKRVVGKYRVKNVDGNYIWVETIMQPLVSVSGTRSFIGTTRDVSKRILAEQELKNTLEKERELNDLKSRFITTVSHEFRTPLASIQSSIGLLEMYAEDLGSRFMKPFEKHFLKITSQVGRINDLLKNIDILGKIESAEIQFNPVKQNLTEFLVQYVNEKLFGEFPDREVELNVSGEESVQFFDATLFEKLLSVLFKNAILYSKEGVIQCNLKYADSGFSISITDSGFGIPEEEMQHLFTSFFRAKNIVNLNIPGNGLGLHIAKKIVDTHSGEIMIKSEENIGTTATISFNTNN